MQNYSFWANLKSTVKTELELVPLLLFDIIFSLPLLMWHLFVCIFSEAQCLRRGMRNAFAPVNSVTHTVHWWETLISRLQEYFFLLFSFLFLSDILVLVNSVTDTDKKLSAGLGVVNPARLKQLRLFTYTNCFFTKHLSSFRRKKLFALIWHKGDIFYFSLISTYAGI